MIANDLLVALITLAVLGLLYYKWSYQYWKRKGLPFLTPTFPYGNMRGPSNVKETEYTVIHRCYEDLRSKGLRHGGIYSMTKPLYVPVDAEIIKHILITDFRCFYNRAIYSNEKYDPVSAHLLALEGQRWKNMRVKLTPAFTSGKMKGMFDTMLQCGDQLREALEQFDLQKQPLDIRELIACYTTDIIGSCAFGIDCNSFKEPDPEFRRFGRKMFRVDMVRRIVRLLTSSFPDFSRRIGLPSIPKEVSKFFLDMARNTVEHRKDDRSKRNDLLQILIDLHKEFEPNSSGGLEAKEGEAKTSDYNRRPLTIEEIAANCFLFFAAGFETSSTTMSFLFYELSQNEEVQEKMRKEINAVLEKHDGKITYEALQEMKYMRQTFDETLRKYPVLPLFKRMCTEDYRIPCTDVTLEKGTSVYISVIGVQNNPDYFEDPGKFDPERFSDENKNNIKDGSYLGFGEGPRICIGKRFGVMQMSIAMIKLLRSYRIQLNPKTKAPVELDPNSFLLGPKGSIWIDLQKI